MDAILSPKAINAPKLESSIDNNEDNNDTKSNSNKERKYKHNEVRK